MWQGELNAAGVGIEISELSLDQNATPSRLRQAWTARRAGQARPVIVFASAGPDQLLVCGPDGTPPPVATISAHLGERIFNTILAELPVPATRRAIDLFNRAQGSGAVPGFRNRNLVSTHYVTQVIRRTGRPEWTDAREQGHRALGQSGEMLLRALGYELEPMGPKEYRVQDSRTAVAIAHVYEDGTSLDRVGPAQAAPPSAIALKRARELGLDHALLIAGSLIRMYSLQAEEMLDEGAASAAYVEFDTDLLPAAWAPLLGALAAPDALRPNGRLQRLRTGSARYAVGLRERFTERLYEEVVDLLVRGIYQAAARANVGPRPNEEELYRATLVLLFRLLFLLYAEDRDLLPMGNTEYAANSVTRKVIAAAQPGRRFDEHATSIWGDLQQLFDAVAMGNADWGVPPYDGGLFTETDGLDGGLLTRIELPNAVVGPALVALGWDESPDGESGKIDFGDLGVRHIGTIYEGLLSYEIAFATENLRIERRAEGEPYVPAGPGEPVDVPVGTPYVRSPQGGRKATGSYYTPVFAVDRLVDKALRPAMEEHLARVGVDLELPTATLFDFRVADIAMGSGHFLVAALDALTERYATYLAASPNRALRDELDRARERLNVVGETYGSPQLGDRVADVDLLRRIVLKRCIYGVDLNPMAVELARLGLWLHSLVPGLPLSYLGANLQHGNSLVGVGSDVPAIGLFALQFEEAAAAKAAELASTNDLELGDIARGQELQEELDEATVGLRDYYDVVTAGPLLDRNLGEVELHAETIIERRADTRVAGDVRAARDTARDQAALHWRLAFPTVFLRRVGPGFDVILGNPPWEEVTVERLGFFVRHLPGLKSIRSQAEQERRIAEFAATYTTVRERYEAEVADKQALRRYLAAKYTLTRSGDPDLYKAFAERFLGLLREGGRVGVVLPRGAFSGDGTAPFRVRLLGSSVEASLDFVLNNRQWMFPDVHPQYTIVLLAAKVGAAPERTLSVSAVAASRKEFDEINENRTTWTLAELRVPHPDLAVPLLPSAASARLYQRVVTRHPRFDSGKGGWRAVPWAELHATNDRKSELLKEPGNVAGEWWPVYGGRSFDLWEPELWRRDGELSFVLEPEVGLRELQRKRLRSDVWRAHFRPEVLRDPATLPQHQPRILFRDVTNRTNSRTCIAALVPPRVFAINTAPSLIWPSGDETDQAYLLGVMASVPFDWFARRRVETHLSYFVLNSLPVPRPPRDDPRWRRVVDLAGRLASVDDQYAEFARACRVDCGPLELAEKVELIAELDAVVGHLYGIDLDELAQMFEDFPATEPGVSPGRRAAALEHYRSWAS
jgi:Eco57I restriction-modification methylase